MPTLPRERIDYSAIVDRPPLKLPGGARIVFWTIVNLEVWDIGKPMARQVRRADRAAAAARRAELELARRYGMRVGYGASSTLSPARHPPDALDQCARVRGLSPRRRKKRGSPAGIHGPSCRRGPIHKRNRTRPG